MENIKRHNMNNTNEIKCFHCEAPPNVWYDCKIKDCPHHNRVTVDLSKPFTRKNMDEMVDKLYAQRQPPTLSWNFYPQGDTPTEFEKAVDELRKRLQNDK